MTDIPFISQPVTLPVVVFFYTTSALPSHLNPPPVQFPILRGDPQPGLPEDAMEAPFMS